MLVLAVAVLLQALPRGPVGSRFGMVRVVALFGAVVVAVQERGDDLGEVFALCA